METGNLVLLAQGSSSNSNSNSNTIVGATQVVESTMASALSKINDLLEAVRQEFAQISQEANSYRLQNQKDYDSKINQQLAEMQQIRNTVYELELTHRKMKDAYEEEINRLKIELDQRDRQLNSYSIQQQQQQQQHQHQPSQPQTYTPVQSNPQYHQQQQQQQTGMMLQPPNLPMINQQQQQQQPPVVSQPSVASADSRINMPSPFQQQQQLHHQQQQQQLQHKPAPVIAPAGSATTEAAGQAQPAPAGQAPPQLPALAPAPISPAPAAQEQQEAERTVIALVDDKQAVAAATNSATPAVATASATSTPSAVTATSAEQSSAAQKTDQENHYLVPYNQRANHTKPIPPFLLDLDSQTVPAHLKKQTKDYYILYNPALPREIDVELHKTLDHTSVVCCVRFSNDGQYLATGCNKTTQVYKISTGELVARLSDDSAATNSTNNSSTDPNSKDATAQADGDLNANGQQNNTDSADPATANGTAASNDTSSFATSTSTSSDLYIRSVCFSPDGKFLATGAEDRLIRIWDIQQKKIVMVLQGHEQDIYSLDYFPSGEKLVSGSGDRTVRIWDLRTGQCSLTLSIEDGVTTVAVSSGDGKYVAAGSLDRAVRVWDSETGFLVERLDSENELGTGHKDSVYSVVFTRDVNNVVSGSLDRSVKLWNLRGANSQGVKPNAQSTCEVTYTGHKDFVLSVATTQNDEYILSGSKDRGVLFWDTKSGNPLLMLQGHRNSVISVAVANGFPLGQEYGVFATGSGDCKARIWKYKKIPADQQKITAVQE